VWLQAIAFQEPGQWDCRSGLTSPGRRYSDMSACVCLYSVTDSQDQDSIPGRTLRGMDMDHADRRTRDRRSLPTDHSRRH
jgi:hypothetical protein